jgi:hypothetical protein
MTTKKLSEILREDPHPEELEARRAILDFFEMGHQERAAEWESLINDPDLQKRDYWPAMRDYLKAVHEASPDVRKAYIDKALQNYEAGLRRSMIARAKY